MGTLALGLDVGGTKILGRLVDPTEPQREIGQVRLDTPRGEPAILDALHEAVELVRQTQAVAVDIGSIGVGLAGQVDLHGVLRYAPNLPTTIDFDPGSSLAVRWPVPIVAAELGPDAGAIGAALLAFEATAPAPK
jgi:predicted NBD/HSP70 family sugar kinase